MAYEAQVALYLFFNCVIRGNKKESRKEASDGFVRRSLDQGETSSICFNVPIGLQQGSHVLFEYQIYV